MLQNNNSNNTTAPIEHTPAKISKTNNEISDNIRDLNEILVVTHPTRAATATKIKPPRPSTESSTAAAAGAANNWPAAIIYGNDSDSATTTNMAKSKQSAPIACEEDDCDELEEATNEWLIDNETKEQPNDDKSGGEEDVDGVVDDDVKRNQTTSTATIIDDDTQQHQQPVAERGQQLQPIGELLAINETVMRRSKSSRVRNYLRKCKDRWLAVGTGGHNNANAEPSMSAEVAAANTSNLEHNDDSPATTATTMSDAVIMNESNVSKRERCRPQLVTVVSSNPNSMVATLGGNADAGAENPDNDGSRHRRRYTNCALGCVEEMEDDVDADADSYEDIDFGLVGYDAIDTTSSSATTTATVVTDSTQSDTAPGNRILPAKASRPSQEKSMQLAQRPGEGHDNGDNDNCDDNGDDPADSRTDVNLKGFDEQQLVVDSGQMVSRSL